MPGGAERQEQIDGLLARIAELERAQRERDTLTRLATRLAAVASAGDLMDALCEESDRLLHWDCCYLVRRSPARSVMTVVRYVDTVDGRKQVFAGEELTPENAGPGLRRALAGEAVLYNRDSGEPVPPMVPFGTGRPSASLLFAPVRCGDAVSGVLSVQSYTPGRYGQADLECLQRIADVIAPALERVNTEDELREAEARYRALVERIPAITYIAAMDGISSTKYVSPQSAALLGYTPADYAADADLWRKRLHPDDRERVMAEVARCHATGAPFACEYRMIARDGRVVWFRDEATIIHNEAGRAVCLQGVMIDITERKSAEELLRLQRDLAVALNSASTLPEAMRMVLDAAVSIDGVECGGVYVADEATGGFRLVAHTGLSATFVEAVSYVAADSPQARRLATARPIYAAVGSLAEHHPACDAEGLQAIAILPVVHEGQVIGALNVAARQCGELSVAARHTLEAIAARIGGAIDRIRSREALERARDELERRVEQRTADLRAANEALRAQIAERDRAEAALSEREARIRSISDNLVSGMIYQIVRREDGSRRFTYLSDAVRRFYGVTPQEAMADPNLIYGRVHEADRLRLWQEEEESHRTLSVFSTEVRMIGPAGDIRWSAFVSSPRRLADGSTCWDGIEYDITERKRAEEERERLNARLREAQRLETIGRFGRGVAHEFNNLMATVLGLASNMRAGRRPEDPDHAKLVHIEEAARAAGDLAHQLLAFARGGRLRTHVLPFGEVLRAALVLVPPMIRPDVAMEHRIAPDLWRVNCDQTQVQHVIVNLCRNAVEAMPHGGRLTITAENRTLAAPLEEARPSLPGGDYVCLSVEDTGLGMDAETMKRIFDPFFSTKERGHGLGLAAAYGIMAAHGGGISVTSEIGKGSTFRMWLPRARTAGEEGASHLA